MSDKTIALVSDFAGRSVRLTKERWGHIVDGHPELAPYRKAILDALVQPTKHLGGRAASEEWYYLAEVGPSNWLKVVVSYENSQGTVITAFARRSMP